MGGDPYSPDYEYIAYVDESGETGLTYVLGVDAHGSSEWFTLSVVVVRKSEEPNIAAWVRDMIVATNSHQLRNLHFSKLNNTAKDAVSRYMATKPIMCFVVCSNKKNIRRYSNPRVEAAMMSVKDWYYCWITRVALERATHFVRRRSMQTFGEPKRVKVIFNERDGLRIGQMGAYNDWIKLQSSADNLYLPWGDLEWETVHPLLLDRDFHKNLNGLKLADVLPRPCAAYTVDFRILLEADRPPCQDRPIFPISINSDSRAGERLPLAW